MSIAGTDERQANSPCAWMSEKAVVSCFFFSSRRRHTRCSRDWSSDVCSSDLALAKRLIDEKLSITWWGNIRFEKTFTPELCRLLAAAGCVAVCGGLEAASDQIGRASCRERV